MNEITPSDDDLQRLMSLYQAGRYDEAEVLVMSILESFPGYQFCWKVLGTLYGLTNRQDKALIANRQAVVLEPKDSEAHYNLGNTFQELGVLEEAIESYSEAIALRFDYAEAHYNLGVQQQELGRLDEAEASYRQAIKNSPNLAVAHNNLGKTLAELGRLEEAINSFNKAIAIKPDYADAHNNLGNTFLRLGRLEEAEAAYRQAITSDPQFSQGYNNLGIALKTLSKLEEAEASFRQAIALKPDLAIGYRNLGGSLRERWKLEEALINYESALALDSKLDYLLGDFIHLKQALCSWDGLFQRLDELEQRINQGEKAAQPFVLHALIDSPEMQKRCSEIYSDDKYPRLSILPTIRPYFAHKKIRIGYFSVDFRAHPVTTVVADLFKYHDREKFEIHAFSFGPDVNDQWNIRVREGVDFYHDVQKISNREIVQLARSIEIDIAVDLTGHTKGNRTDIFAMSAAPIQLVYIGFLGTMGSSYYDYIVADSVVIPEKNKDCYTESIIWLPSYQVNSQQIEFPDSSLDRQNFGIPEDVFVFCCLNITYKITPDVFDSWARILFEVKDSVLMLLVNDDVAIKNLQEQISIRGIDPCRLIFTGRLRGPSYWSRYQAVDLFLDTFYCSGGATSSDALRMGCPVLTWIGDSFSSRFGGSILTALGLPEMITTTQAEYESRAVYLAKNPTAYMALKKKLKANISTEPLYDTQRFTNSIESAYAQIQDRCQKGEKPNDIYVD